MRPFLPVNITVTGVSLLWRLVALEYVLATGERDTHEIQGLKSSTLHRIRVWSVTLAGLGDSADVLETTTGIPSRWSLQQHSPKDHDYNSSLYSGLHDLLMFKYVCHVHSQKQKRASGSGWLV